MIWGIEVAPVSGRHDAGASTSPSPARRARRSCHSCSGASPARSTTARLPSRRKSSRTIRHVRQEENSRVLGYQTVDLRRTARPSASAPNQQGKMDSAGPASIRGSVGNAEKPEVVQRWLVFSNLNRDLVRKPPASRHPKARAIAPTSSRCCPPESPDPSAGVFRNGYAAVCGRPNGSSSSTHSIRLACRCRSRARKRCKPQSRSQ